MREKSGGGGDQRKDGSTARHASESWHLSEIERRLPSMRGGYVYIMSNKPHGVPYTGVTANLAARVWQHKSRTGSQFCRKYNCDKLVFAEAHATIDEAIARERAIKAWPRLWKLQLIHEANPNWDDLFERIHW